MATTDNTPNVNLFDPEAQNAEMQKTLKNSINSIFPLTSGGKRMDIINIRIDDTLDQYDYPEQKEIKLNRRSWQIPIVADFVISDEKTGRVIHQSKNTKIGNVPKITNRFTTIIDGNEYQTVNQIRRRSGIYSRIKKNGELEAEFNLAKGQNFKMELDPISQIFNIMYANRKIRLWTLLSTIGVPEEEIQKKWGKELLDINKKGALNTEASEMTYLYKKLYRNDPKSYQDVIDGIIKYFETGTEIDPDTTKITLGESFDRVSGKALLAASTKLLNINKGKETPDERDSLVYKRIYAVDDLLVDYFDKNAQVLKKKLTRSLGMKEKVGEIISASTFGEPIKRFFTTGDLSSTPAQTNPVTMASEWRKTTPMGMGGIKSSHAITLETRDIQPTHLGFLDPLSTPESGKVGVAVGLASEVSKVGNEMSTPVRTPAGKLTWLSPTKFYNYKVGFPDQFNMVDGKLVPFGDKVNVMHKGEVKKIPASEVDYYIRSPRSMFSFPQNLVPFMANTQGNRASTGARMITQAISLDTHEAPLVQTWRDSKSTYEGVMGSFLIPYPKKPGTVTKIDENYIYVKNDDDTENKYGLYNNFPLNQDGYLNSKIKVKVGDKVTTNTLLFDHNYSTDGTLSLGKNLNVAYMSYKGYNFEDGAVITESAAKQLSHTTIHRTNVFFSPKLAIFDKSKFNAWYPDEMHSTNFQKLDDEGIVKVGETVEPGEVVCAFLVKRELDDVEAALKKLDKYTFHNYMKNVSRWDQEEVGVVTDVRKVGRNVDIYIKSVHPMKEGDKIAGRFGNKSIVTKIIPDSDAPHRLDGTPIDVMMSPEGVPGRMNIGQILETAAGKIADKTGKPYVVKNFDDPNSDMANKVYKEMKDLGIEPNEVLIDGKTGKKIETPIFVGKQYILKLRHIVDKKEGVHNIGNYDVNEQPVGKGSQTIGIMESYAYLAHGAKSNLREFTEIKGRKNEEYWRDLQFGLLPGKPNRNFIFDKFETYLNGAGVNTKKEGNRMRIFPLTDKDIMEKSNGELTDVGAMLVGKNLRPRKGGLFDPTITGGANGAKWGHVELATRVPNPMYEDAIIKSLDLTGQKFENIMTGKDELDGKTGLPAIVAALSKIDVDSALPDLKEQLKNAPPTNVNKLNTKIKYLQALKDLNLNPVDAYTITKIPVIPPVFRPVYPLPSGALMVSGINQHYRDVGLINNGLKDIMKDLTDKDKVLAQNDLYRSIKALQGFIDPITYSKEKYKGFVEELARTKVGLIHGKLWRKRQDVSARSTITVDPDLGIDEVGLPRDMAYTMMKPFVIKEMKESGLKASEALKQYEEKTPMAWNALKNVTKQRPVIINRAPSLHKHSVQAFKPVLMDGKAIRLNPMIEKGFNADFDGDTMSVMVPIGREAITEAANMMPSKILFKHGDNSLVPELSKDYIYGLYEASLIKTSSNKSFKSLDAAKASDISWNEEVTIAGKKSTIGQYIINEPLPEKFRDYKRTMDSKTASTILKEVGKISSELFAEVMNTWKTLGAAYSYMVGHTISITDFAIKRDYRNNILKTELAKAEKLPTKEKVEVINNLTKKVQDAQQAAAGKDNNMYKMLTSGSFTKPDSVRQVLSMPGLVTGLGGKIIEYPITKSYGEGLDTTSYWNTLYGVRTGTVDRAVNTQESGALNKALLNVTRRLLVVQEDCGTKKGLEYELNDKNVMDRTLVNTIAGIGKRNDVVDDRVVNNARSKSINKLLVRSPLTCDSVNGVCQMCYGLLPDGKFPAIGTNVGILDSQAVTERATQLTMQTFHSGGSALAGGGIVAGFPRLEQLLTVPQKLSGKATLADQEGVISKITKNPTGGYNIFVNTKMHVVPAGRMPIVTVGQRVQKGDALSEGVIKPQELGSLKSHLDAQKYMVNEASKVYGDKFYKKTFETMVRGISDNAEVTYAPDGSGFLRGDKTTISNLEAINKKRVKEGLEAIEYIPYFKSIETLNTDNDDWLVRMSTNRIQQALTTGAAKAQYSNLKGKDPVPAYLYGDNFGKDFNPDEEIFY